MNMFAQLSEEVFFCYDMKLDEREETQSRENVCRI